jgi:hypothetical protein
VTATPLIIPIVPVNSQTLTATLGNQAVRVDLYTKHLQVPVHPPGSIVTNPPIFEEVDPLFLNLYLNDALILGGVLCLNNVGIVRNRYFGFVGDLAFTDLQGDEDPRVSGLGLRWLLNYWPDLR